MAAENNISVSHISETYYDYGPLVISILSITMVIFMILAFMGNVLVILTVIRHKGMKTRTNMFIVNLAVADVLVAMFNMPFSLITIVQGDWIFGDAFCQFNGFLVPLFFIVSIQTLMYIGIHKYISITRPFSQFMTPRKILVMIGATWVWGGICAGTTLSGGNHVLYKKGASQCGPSIPDELNEYIHSLMITTCNYILPLAVMSFCYFNIFREIHEHMHRIRETSNVDLERSLDQQKRISCTLFLVLACFFICWTPFIAYSCTAAFRKDKSLIPLIGNPAGYWCGYMNSACNPIIYALRSKSYRQGYKEILCNYRFYSIGGSIASKPSQSQHNIVKTANAFTLSSSESNEGKRLLGFPNTLSTSSSGNQSIDWSKLPIQQEAATFPIEPLDVGPTPSIQFAGDILNLNIRNQKRTTSLVEVNGEAYEFHHSTCTKHRSTPSFSEDVVSIRANGESKFVGFDRSPMHSFFAKCQQFPTIGSESLKDGFISEAVSINAVYDDVFNASFNENLLPPIVVIDTASLKSSCASEVEKSPLNIRRASEFAGCIANCRNSLRQSPKEKVSNTLSTDSWSPSIKSLEMGRTSSRKYSNQSTRNKLSEGVMKTPEIKSPLYGASKDELMKWMSEDNLDKLDEDSTPENQLRKPSTGRNSFSISILAGFRKTKRSKGSESDSSSPQHGIPCQNNDEENRY